MQITGQNHLSVDPQTAWVAFHDAGVLERSLPGAQSLREVEPGRFAMTVVAGVAAIKGSYDGFATFSQEQEPESFVLSLTGSGGPGTVDADVHVRLSPAEDGGTDLDWTADAVVGGPVGGVGQRMLSGVAKRLATQFFNNIDKDLAAGGSEAAAAGQGGSDGAQDAADGGSGEQAAAQAPALRAAGGAARPALPSPAGVAASAPGQLLPILTGAAVALVGVALGARLRRR
ncbi:SRPBCC family protein [Ornithinimicrobium sufpigmenti]|uniref:SRPBCC family protein n=1 Tax=Ornithinimicrobium sufpigmenti TaxID=2508882 RepID=UPI0010368E3D|nr:MULTISPECIES: carbon monoxide dehydrogenase subunit G [unclassified Ornithinimicrobium]